MLKAKLLLKLVARGLLFAPLLFCSSTHSEVPFCSPANGLYLAPPHLEVWQNDEIKDLIYEVENYWTSKEGFIRLFPTYETGNLLDNENPVLFTSEYLFILKQLGVLKGEVKEEWKKKIIGMVDSLRLEPGLFNRYPGKTDEAFKRHFSRDEQIGLVTLDFVFDWKLGLAKELYDYGRHNAYVYENRTWISKGIHGRKAYSSNGTLSKGISLWAEGQRLPQFIELLRMAADRNHNWAGQFMFRQALGVTMDRPTTATSGKIMAYLRIAVFMDRTDASNTQIATFLTKMKYDYGNKPFHEILKIYYRHPDHPLRKLSKYLL